MSELRAQAASHLRAMRELLSERSRWCTGAVAEGAAGQEVLPNDPAAVRWCLAGAWSRCLASTGDEARLSYEALLAAAGCDNWNQLIKKQDRPETTLAWVHSVLDRAILIAEGKADGP
jgi:hypothetical protein